MKILIYGADVIGQIYAARLHEVGHDVTVLPRHRTLETLARARYEAPEITVAELARALGVGSWPRYHLLALQQAP
jgi:2-dehydropantoate 2-reductase